MKFPNDSLENLLDFGVVRVGDFADRTFTLKNIGLYKLKISFQQKKKLSKEAFKI